MLWATVSAEETCRLGKGQVSPGVTPGPLLALGYRRAQGPVGRGLADEAASV